MTISHAIGQEYNYRRSEVGSGLISRLTFATGKPLLFSLERKPIAKLAHFETCTHDLNTSPRKVFKIGGAGKPTRMETPGLCALASLGWNRQF
jgi:hypothetical protein